MKIVNYYSDDFKLKVIQEVLSGEITKEEARRKYHIRGKSAVLNWMRKFGYLSEIPKENLILCQMKKTTTNKISDSELNKLKAEKEALQEELKLAKLKLEGYQIMLRIGKEKLGIDLEKKSGAKQS